MRNPLSASQLPNYLVCADGDSTEIVEASSATFIQVGSAAYFNQYQVLNSGK